MDYRIQNWLNGFPKEEVERKIRELETELQHWRDALAIHESLSGTPEAGGSDNPIPTKPQAIGVILQEAGRPLKSKEIRSEMISRGWLPDGPKATKRFYSTMTRLKGEDRIKHLPDGTYTLPNREEAKLELA